MQLGDMTIVGYPPAKLVKACAVIADALHPTFDQHPRIKTGISKESCVLCSLTVRDFLCRIGFPNARVRSVAAYVMAYEGETMLHSVGMGFPDAAGPVINGRWAGHLVVEADGFLIDTVLYAAARPQWRDQLPAMIVVPIAKERERLFNMDVITAIAVTDDKFELSLAYVDRSDNAAWKHGPDGRDKRRRMPVVYALCNRWSEWRGR